MKKILTGCLGVMAVVLAAQLVRAEACDTACNPCDMACGKKSLWYWGAHAEAGLFANRYGNTNLYDEDGWMPDSGNTALLKNARHTDVQLNQLYLSFGKKLDPCRGLDFGGRIDYMYGTDALLVQSKGLEYDAGHGSWNSGDYYSALPQAYFEVGYKKLGMKFGKFLSGMNHDSLVSTDRFFYTLSDSYMLTPNTLSGAVLTWNVNKKLSVFGGWVNGDRWEIDFDDILDGERVEYHQEDYFFDSSHNNAFYGGADYAFNKRLNFGYSVMIGRDTTMDEDEKMDRNYFVQSFIVGFKPGKRWDYTFEWTLRNETRTEVDEFEHQGGYGINQELLYRFNSKWSAGARVEWIHFYGCEDDQDVSLTGQGEQFDDNKYSFSLGLNWTPTRRFLVRPELRYDKFEGIRPFNLDDAGWAKKHQLSGGVSAIVKL